MTKEAKLYNEEKTVCLTNGIAETGQICAKERNQITILYYI